MGTPGRMEWRDRVTRGPGQAVSPERGPGTHGAPSPELKPLFWGGVRPEPGSRAASALRGFEDLGSWKLRVLERFSVVSVLRRAGGTRAAGTGRAHRATRTDLRVRTHAGAQVPLWLVTDEPSRACGAGTQSKPHSGRPCHKQTSRGSVARPLGWTGTLKRVALHHFYLGEGLFAWLLP